MQAFDDLLFSYAQNEGEAGRKEIEERLWKTFGVEGAVFVLDMSGFSLLTRRHGIVYYLAMVRTMQRIVKPIIESQGGKVVKFEADNCFAYLPDVPQAVHAGIEINIATAEANKKVQNRQAIEVACGIDFGKFLLIDEKDYFGDPVNLASKLGEDLSKPGEILVAASSRERIDEASGIKHEPVTFSISGLELEALRILH